MRNWKMFALVTVFASLGCGGEDNKKNSVTGSSDAALCKRICARSQAPRCENDEEDCADSCEALIDQTPSKCDDAREAFTSCAEKATFTCDENDEAEAKSCAKHLAAWTSCMGGVVGRTANEDADSDTTSPSSGRGDAGRPRLPTPISEPAGDAGICAPTDDDDVCTTCVKGDCCELLAACDDDCQSAVACVSACDSEDCARECLASSSPGVQALLALSACQARSCRSECSVNALRTTTSS